MDEYFYRHNKAVIVSTFFISLNTLRSSCLVYLFYLFVVGMHISCAIKPAILGEDTKVLQRKTALHFSTYSIRDVYTMLWCKKRPPMHNSVYKAHGSCLLRC